MTKDSVVVRIRKWTSDNDPDDSLHAVPADVMAELERYVRDGADPKNKALADALQEDFLRLVIGTQKDVGEIHRECAARWIREHCPMADILTFSFDDR